MKDPYSQLAVTLWFLPLNQLWRLVKFAEQLALEHLEASFDRWTVS